MPPLSLEYSFTHSTPDAAPTVDELHTLLVNAVHVHSRHACGGYMDREQLRQTDARAGSVLTGKGAVLESLDFLQYCPGGSNELGWLMANLQAPSLLELYISLEKDKDIAIVPTCGGLFQAAVKMHINSGHQTMDDVRELYALTPAVSSLDIVLGCPQLSLQ